MNRPRLLLALLLAAVFFAALAGTLVATLVANRGGTTVVERVPQTVMVTPRIPEVTRRVTVQVTVPVTVVVTRVARRTVIITATPVPPPAGLDNAAASQAAVRWLIGQQRNDGGFGSVRNTAWTILALAAAGVDPANVLSETERSPLDYLDNVIATDQVAGAENTALTALALAGAGHRPPEPLELAVTPAPTAWPALPLLVMALGQAAPDALVSALASAQTEDGGFGDVRNTAWAILALAAAGEEAPIAGALDYLRARQRADGAWPAPNGNAPDPLATALTLQALVAAEQNLARWRDPLHVLISLQASNGSFADDIPTTAAAIIAIRQATSPP